MRKSKKRAVEYRALLGKVMSVNDRKAGATYYSEADIKRIIAALPDSTKVNREAVWENLEKAAGTFYWCVLWEYNVESAPSLRARGLVTLGSNLDKVLKKLQNLPPLSLDDLNNKLFDSIGQNSGLAEYRRIRFGSEMNLDDGTDVWGEPTKLVVEIQDTINWLREAVTLERFQRTRNHFGDSPEA